MHATLEAIHSQREKLSVQIQSTVPSDEPVALAHGQWTGPGLTKSELLEELQELMVLIEERGGETISSVASETRVKDYVRRLEFLRSNTVPQIWSTSAGQAISAFYLTMRGLHRALTPLLEREPQVEAAAKLRKLITQLRSMEARFRELDPRTASISTMVERIEKAFEAADQLPTDLEALEDAQKKIAALLVDAGKDQSHLLNVKEDADFFHGKLSDSVKEAALVLERCETAYRASTSVGLAAAFSERSTALEKSIWFWIAGLVLALGLGGFLGAGRLHDLSALLSNPDASTPIVVLNLMLSIFSVAAPVWFAWLATKQIGHRFKLSEDYAFKASVSRAYEGFRSEAARVDPAMEARLLSSALTRFDELPLRLVETDTHGSPWHELARSDVVKQAVSVVPNFGQQVKALADKAVAALASKQKSAAAKPEADSE